MTTRLAPLCKSSDASATSQVGSTPGPTVMHSRPPPLLNHVTDLSTYGAIVSDACEYNRGLSRRRASRLPFLDLATHALQRPAPWLHRPPWDRSKDALNLGTHVVFRYLRHKWRPAVQTAVRRRKLVADRLWHTLQTSLRTLGISSEMMPLVIRKAYAIAGLPVPASVISHLDVISVRNMTGVQQSVLLSTVGRAHLNPSCFGTKRTVQPDSWSEPISRRQTASTREDDSVVDECMVDEYVGLPKQSYLSIAKTRPPETTTPVASGEDSVQSNDYVGLKRCTTEDASTELRTDDEVSVQSGTGTKLSSNSDGARVKSKQYGLQNESDEDDCRDEEDDEDEDGEDDDQLDDDDDDDVEWLQPRGRRSSRRFPNERSFACRSRKTPLSSHKTGCFSMLNPRLSGRRITKGRVSQIQHTLYARDKLRPGRLSTVLDIEPSNDLPGRRSVRINNASKIKASTTYLTAPTEKDNIGEDSWDDVSEPGFQPNIDMCSIPDGRPTTKSSHPAESFGGRTSRSYSAISPLTAPTPTSNTCGPLNAFSNSLAFNSGVAAHSIIPLPDPRRLVQPTSLLPSSLSSRPCISVSPISRPTTSPLHLPAPNARTTMAQLLTAGSFPTGGGSTELPSMEFHSVPMHDSTGSNSVSVVEMNASEMVRMSTVHTSKRIGQKAPVLTSTSISLPSHGAELQVPGLSPPLRAPNHGPEQFTAPQGATTTVTFFVCEVCASRYRSTAGLRYHYHSQHSGYTPKNPISASASRLVVPVGEERGIGGGLRGGRPRRNKASTVDGRVGRPRSKECESKSPTRFVLADAAGSSPIPSIGNDASGVVQPFTCSPSRHPSVTSSHCYLSSLNRSSNLAFHLHDESSVSNRSSSNRIFVRTQSTDHCLGGTVDETNSVPSNSRTSTFASSPIHAHTGGQSATPEVFELSHTTASHRSQHKFSLISIADRTTPNLVPRTYSSSVSSAANSGNSFNNSVGWLPSDVSFALTSPDSSQLCGPYRASPAQRRFDRQHCADSSNSNLLSGSSCMPVCVYCLSDDRLNPRLGHPEGLLRCSRCETWAHFTCLQLPAHVIELAMRYSWQCIECKTCWLCGSSEQESQMAFCSDCDRTFHIDCLPVPLSRVPTSQWSCDICLNELYTSPTKGDKPNPPPILTEASFYAGMPKGN